MVFLFTPLSQNGVLFYPILEWGQKKHHMDGVFFYPINGAKKNTTTRWMVFFFTPLLGLEKHLPCSLALGGWDCAGTARESCASSPSQAAS